MPKGKPFKHGEDDRRAKGGARPGAGRPPDEFRLACQKALQEANALEFMRGVAQGEDFPQLATSEGEVLPLPPSLKDRQRAIEWLADRGYGKANQPMEVTGGDGTDFSFLPTRAITEILEVLRRRVDGKAGGRP